MRFTYILFLLTFLCYPILAVKITRRYGRHKVFSIIKIAALFFIIHNLLFLIGFSLKGDYIDYCIFSLEYFTFCVGLSAISRKKQTFVEIVRICAIGAMWLVFTVGIPGIFLFPVISQDYVTDKIFYFTNDNGKCETRRYSFGTIGSENTRYNFETYREYNYLPFEKKIDKTIFFDEQTNLNIGEDSLNISIQQTNNKRWLVFASTNGHKFAKPVE